MNRLIILLFVMLLPSIVFASFITKENIENSIEKLYPDAAYTVTDNTITITITNNSLLNETTNSIDMTEAVKVDLNADYQKLNQLEDISTLFDDNINNQNDFTRKIKLFKKLC